MTSKLTWVWHGETTQLGKLGDVTAFRLRPYSEGHDGFKLTVVLPGYSTEARVQHNDSRAGKRRADEILEEWLERTGLQFRG